MTSEIGPKTLNPKWRCALNFSLALKIVEAPDKF